MAELAVARGYRISYTGGRVKTSLKVSDVTAGAKKTLSAAKYQRTYGVVGLDDAHDVREFSYDLGGESVAHLWAIERSEQHVVFAADDEMLARAHGQLAEISTTVKPIGGATRVIDSSASPPMELSRLPRQARETWSSLVHPMSR